MTGNGNGEKCPIWPSYKAELLHRDIFRRTKIYSSPRAGGEYEITDEAERRLEFLDDDSIRARLTTLLVDLRAQGEQTPSVTTDMVNQAQNEPSLPVYVRADRLLKFFVDISRTIGEPIPFSIFNDVPLRSQWHSDSKSPSEAMFLVDYLKEKRWIQINRNESTSQSWVIVTVDGHARNENLVVNPDTSQCFVAMWFHETMNRAYQAAIKPAIDSAGFKAKRADESPDYLGKLDDHIIAEIRRSRFLVADFTHKESKGVRGSVYYEAGFAHGIDIPVIYTCRKDQVDLLHFDTRQYPHVLWKSHDELKSNLEARILAAIGQGPEPIPTESTG